MSAGCSYFGVRIVRHVARDMHDLARRGYTGVLHTYSENDLMYYRETMNEIVSVSHAAGLTVQLSPWGLGATFGGEAESRFVLLERDAWQELDDGTRVPAACLNSESYREYCRAWADAGLESGADALLWDEPHWAQPAYLGASRDRWGCRCSRCRELYELQVGAPMPTELTPEVQAFREACQLDFLRDLVGYVAAQGGQSTVCLLPLAEGPHGVSDWEAVGRTPGLTTLATDPYWKFFKEPAEAFVRRFAKLLVEAAAPAGVGAQLWVPSFGLTREDIPDLEAAIAAAREAGIDDLWTWGYEACGHMAHLATPDSAAVWEAVTTALVEPAKSDLARLTTEQHRPDLLDLDLRSTGSLVRLMNTEDRLAVEAVAEIADELATAVDAIVERLARGGRLVYVGVGTSGRLATLDAVECEPTFGVSPDRVVAVVTESGAAEDDRAAGADALRALGLTADDAVVGLTASGRSPYVLAAMEVARAAGALTVGLVCCRDSELARVVQHRLEAVVGPEVVTGSTRLKAGTAQKLILNMISTVAMVKLGRTFGNLMVDVVASNRKLRERARRAVSLATNAAPPAVDTAIERAGGDVKVAIVSLLCDLDVAKARERIAAADGVVRRAIGGAV